MWAHWPFRVDIHVDSEAHASDSQFTLPVFWPSESLDSRVTNERVGDSVDVLQFNPWQFAGQDQLFEAFFREIGKKLGQADKSAAGKAIAAKWRIYYAGSKLGASMATGVSKLVPVWILFLGWLGFNISSANGVWCSIVGSLLVIVASVLVLFSGLAQSIENWFRTRSEAHVKTLSEIKGDLAALLRKRTKTLVIVMDDVDRLGAAQTGAITVIPPRPAQRNS